MFNFVYGYNRGESLSIVKHYKQKSEFTEITVYGNQRKRCGTGVSVDGNTEPTQRKIRYNFTSTKKISVISVVFVT